MTRYLVVDDSATVRMRLSAAIRGHGLRAPQIDEAADGDTAMRSFVARPPDAVFLDMILPPQPDAKLDGHAGLDILKVMLEKRPGTPIVLVSAFPADHPDVMAAVSFGAFAHLHKPVRPQDLRRVLDALDPHPNVLPYFG